MDNEKLRALNTTALAYMGDAVYEQAIREHLLEKGNTNVNNLHRAATGYVSAKAQAAIIKAIFDELSDEEQQLARRARNKKYSTKAKNADPITYKWATAFEALVGYFHLAKNEERLSWILKKAIMIIEAE